MTTQTALYSLLKEFNTFDESNVSPDRCFLALSLEDKQVKVAVLDIIQSTWVYGAIYQLNQPFGLEYLDAFKGIYHSLQLGKVKYNKELILVNNTLSTLVPAALYKTEEKESHLGFVTNLDFTVYSAYESFLPNAEIYSVFGFQTEGWKELKRVTPFAKLMHASAVQVESCFIQNRNNKGESIALHLTGNILLMSLWDKDKLLFSNTYPYQTKEDIAYYTLFAVQQCQMNNETLELRISGEGKALADLKETLSPYIRKIELFPLPSFYKYKEQMKEAAELDLLIQSYLCA